MDKKEKKKYHFHKMLVASLGCPRSHPWVNQLKWYSKHVLSCRLPDHGKFQNAEQSYTEALQTDFQDHKRCFNVGSGLGFNLQVVPSS